MKDFFDENRISDNKLKKEASKIVSQSDESPPSYPVPDLERMMEEYGSSLLRLCFMYLRDMHMAEDAVQDTFLKVYKYYFRFAGEGGQQGEKNWVTRIAVNVCKDMLRSAWRRKVNVVDELSHIPDNSNDYDAADDTLLKEVMKLKPKYSEVILLFYYEDMKITDIAKAISAPESTVSVRLKRAREQLKKQIGGWYYGENE